MLPTWPSGSPRDSDPALGWLSLTALRNYLEADWLGALVGWLLKQAKRPSLRMRLMSSAFCPVSLGVACVIWVQPRAREAAIHTVWQWIKYNKREAGR